MEKQLGAHKGLGILVSSKNKRMNALKCRTLGATAFQYSWSLIMRMRTFRRKNNGAVSEKKTHFFPPLPAEYVTVFSGRTDAPEVRLDLTDTHTHRETKYSKPRCACTPRVNEI